MHVCMYVYIYIYIHNRDYYHYIIIIIIMIIIIIIIIIIIAADILVYYRIFCKYEHEAAEAITPHPSFCVLELVSVQPPGDRRPPGAFMR